MAFKMAGYPYPGTPKKQNNNDDESLNVNASIVEMEKTKEGRKKLAELRDDSLSKVLSGSPTNQLATPNKQKDDDDDTTIEEKREASLTSAIGKYNRSTSN